MVATDRIIRSLFLYEMEYPGDAWNEPIYVILMYDNNNHDTNSPLSSTVDTRSTLLSGWHLTVLYIPYSSPN